MVAKATMKSDVLQLPKHVIPSDPGASSRFAKQVLRLVHGFAHDVQHAQRGHFVTLPDSPQPSAGVA